MPRSRIFFGGIVFDAHAGYVDASARQLLENDRRLDLSPPPHLDGTTYRLYLGCMTSRDIIKKLEAAGWVLARTKGSHQHFSHPTVPGIVTVPHPKKDLPTGTVKAIEKQSGVELLPKASKKKSEEEEEP